MTITTNRSGESGINDDSTTQQASSSINPIMEGNATVRGNLSVEGQTTTKGLKVIDDDHKIAMLVTDDGLSFRKACCFTDGAEFNNGKTLIGMETTYHSAYVGTETLQAGQRLVLGDSAAKWDVDTRKIIADTFTMSLATLNSDTVNMKKGVATLVQTKNLQVTNELIGKKLLADTIKTNNLFMERIAALNMTVSKALTVKDIIVNGTGKFNTSVTIAGTGVNGAALTINGGELIANKGIVSHTRNNRFQCMQIMGSGVGHDTCFKVDKDVDSLFQGNVTIEDSKLILDGSTLATDNVLVTPISQLASDEDTTGVQLTTKQDWEDYRSDMVQEYEDSSETSDGYDPYETVGQAIERNRANYENAKLTVQKLVNPISYAMENADPNVPKRFAIKNGIYRVDSNGNTLVKNLVSEKGKFSELEAYKFNINKMNVDKLVTTSVASNVVDTDNLLKSRGLAEFDGTVNVGANVFVEEGAKVNFANESKVTLQSGATLELKDGALFKMGSNTSVKMSGDIELDVNKLVFVDSKTGGKWKLVFRQAVGCEGSGTVVEYVNVTEESSTTRAAQTLTDARELDEKLKKLGM